MDPLTTFLRFAEALIKFATVIAEGQPTDVREKIWRWIVADLEAARKGLGLPV